jgi:hypothetical protein
MDEHQTDYRLWAVSSGAAFLLTWLLLVGTGLEARHLRSPLELLKEGWCVTLFLAAVAAAFGWFVQSVVVVQRDGLRGGRSDPQAEDYDDTPPLS